jgi:hypothetical protein
MNKHNDKRAIHSLLENPAVLIEKYFEGQTTLEEEQALRDYFQQENIAEKWKIYQPIFQFFSSEREPEFKTPIPVKRRMRPVLWFSATAAAACLFLLFSLKFTFNSHTSMAYIDGKKYTDIALIQTEALKALENLSEANEDVYSSQIEALDLFLGNN